MSEIFLIRHAQASFGEDDYDQLSSLGFDQSERLAHYFADNDITFDAVFTGTMKRHRQTLAPLLEKMLASHSPDLHTLEGLNEYDFAALVKAYLSHSPSDPCLITHLSNPRDKTAFIKVLYNALLGWSQGMFQGHESWQEFVQRVNNSLTTIKKMSAYKKRILVISSGGVISTCIGETLTLPPEKIFDLNLQVFNTSVSRLFFTHQTGFQLAGFNSLPHLINPADKGLVSYG